MNPREEHYYLLSSESAQNKTDLHHPGGCHRCLDSLGKIRVCFQPGPGVGYMKHLHPNGSRSPRCYWTYIAGCPDADLAQPFPPAPAQARLRRAGASVSGIRRRWDSANPPTPRPWPLAQRRRYGAAGAADRGPRHRNRFPHHWPFSRSGGSGYGDSGRGEKRKTTGKASRGRGVAVFPRESSPGSPGSSSEPLPFCGGCGHWLETASLAGL